MRRRRYLNPLNIYFTIIGTLRKFWRALRNRCIYCNRHVEFPNAVDGDMVDVYQRVDIYHRHPNMFACRTCNKTEVLAKSYGAGPRTLKRLRRYR